MKDFVSKKPYLFTLLVLGATAIVFSGIQVIVALSTKATAYQAFGIINIILVLAIYILTYIFRKKASKKEEEKK